MTDYAEATTPGYYHPDKESDVPSTHVSMEVDRLASGLDELEKELNILDKRSQIVRMELAGTTTPHEVPPSPARSPLAERLAGLNDRLYSSVQRVSRLIYELDL